MSENLSNYVTRECEPFMDKIMPGHPIMVVSGPRQCGKTTLIQEKFPSLPFVDLEDVKMQDFVRQDPVAFVKSYLETGAIFDEFQHVPEITKALKVVADEIIYQHRKYKSTSRSARFILSGSHDYMISQESQESMIGRSSTLHLPPFTVAESGETELAALMFKGGYPEIHVEKTDASVFFRKYLNEFLTREVKNIHKIQDLKKFLSFMTILANSIGSIINPVSISEQLGVLLEDIRKWLIILEASFIIFAATPYHNSFMKRLVKRPKYYFYDTGLLSYLLDLRAQKDIQDKNCKGPLFENFVIAETKKNFTNTGEYDKAMYFWNIEKDPESDEKPYEIDLLLSSAGMLHAIEIKSSDILNLHWFSGGTKLSKLTNVTKYVIYTGPTQETKQGLALNWRDLGRLVR